MIGLLAQKIGMTQVFDEQGRVTPVTLLSAGPCAVVQVKTPETDGYAALQIGFGTKREKLIPNGLRGHLKKHNAAGVRTLKEVRVDDTAEYQRSHPEGGGEEMKAKRFGIDGKEKGSVELPPEIFEAEVNEHLIWEAVKMFLGNQRQGTAAAKNRAKVSGGGRKPWKQKGTGRARAGSNPSPLWTGGGVAFPPRPRDYTTRLNAKAKLRALCGALTSRAHDGGVVIVDAPSFEAPKTKTMPELIDKIGLKEKKV